jgi:hypothetical protein
MTTYYKFLNTDGRGRFSCFLFPTDRTVTVEGPLEMCFNGIHAAREADLAYWIDAQLWEIELGEEMEEADTKVVSRSGRLTCCLADWNDQTARLFAADCAERALSRQGKTNPHSGRAVFVARRFAFGLASEGDLRNAATTAYAYAAATTYAAADVTYAAAAADATYAATIAATYAATTAATYAADVTYAAAAAATYAADATAAYAAAAAAAAYAAAAAAAARQEERVWQSKRILDYAYGRVDLGAILETVK